jgi:hypothetical protein
MVQSLFATIAIFFASIFGVHHIQHVALHSQSAAAAVATLPTEYPAPQPSAQSQPATTGSTSSPQATIVNQSTTWPAIPSGLSPYKMW